MDIIIAHDREFRGSSLLRNPSLAFPTVLLFFDHWSKRGSMKIICETPETEETRYIWNASLFKTINVETGNGKN